MGALLTSILGGLLRYALAGVMGWLISKGIATPDQTTELISGITGGLVLVGWLIWVKYKDRIKFLTGLAKPSGSTEDDVAYALQQKATPPINTPTDEPPKITPPKIAALFLAVMLGLGSLAGCAPALVSTNPATADIDSARVSAVRIADAVTAGLVIVNEAGKLAHALPLPPTTQDDIDCAIIKVTGTTAPPSARVREVCGAVPNGPGPLHQALGTLADVTATPSLRTTVTAILAVIDPLLTKLEASNQPALRALAVSLRATFGYARAFLGGHP